MPSAAVCNREIPTIVRSLGVNPTTAQLQTLQQAIASAVTAAADAAGGGAPPTDSKGVIFVTLEQCEGLIAAWLLELKDSLARDDMHVLMRAFQALDPDNRGWLDAEQLRGLLTACEDALTADEANAMIAAAADDQGRLNYGEYALRLAADGRAV
jgi:Ca2+-binding EF-hand superfamily protein